MAPLTITSRQQRMADVAVIITEFQLDAFGNGNPLRVLDLGSGLNVALVRDESGCTRLLQEFPWFLYGSRNFFDGAADSPPTDTSGSIHLRTDHGVFCLARSANDSGNALEITSNDGVRFEPAYLANLLDDVAEDTYREVFTFDLGRVAGIVNGGDRGRQRLARLATYLKHKSPPPRGISIPIPRTDLSELRHHIGELTSLLLDSQSRESDDDRPTCDVDKLKRELKKLDTDIDDTQSKLHGLQSEIDQTQCALAISGVQSRLDEVTRELSDARAAKPSKELAVGVEEAIQRLDHKIKACRDERSSYQEEADDLKRQVKELGPVSRTAKLVPQIEALLLQEKTLVKEEAAVENLESQLLDIEARLEAERLQASTRPASSFSSASLDPHAASRVDSIGQRIRETEHELNIAQQRLTQVESSTTMIIDDMARASTLAAHPEDAVAIQEAEQRVAELQESLAMDDQLQQLLHERGQLETSIRRLYAGQLMPFRTMLALGVPFTIGVAMIIHGLIINDGPTQWELVIIGFMAAVAASLIKISNDRGQYEMLHGTRRQLARVRHQIDQVSATREHVARTGVNIARQLEEAQHHLAQLTSRFASREPSTAPDPSFGSASIESARRHVHDLQRRGDELKQQWRELMVELGLSPNLLPQHARDAIASRAASAASTRAVPDKTQSLELQLQHMRHELERRRDWLSMMTSQARQLIKELHYSSSVNSVGEQMDALREAIADFKDKTQTRRQLSRALSRVKQKYARTNENGRRLSEQRRKLDDERSLKIQQQKMQQQVRQDRIKELERGRDRLAREASEIRARYNLSEGTPLADSSEDDLAQRLENQTSRLERLLDRLIRKSEQRGRCRAQLNSSSPAKGPRIAWHEILETTEQVSLACDRSESTPDVAIGNAPARYEHLETASRFLFQLTSGQFHQLHCPEDQVLQVVDRQGQALSLSQIRPEHYANIYFSLWLARLDAFADMGIRLPMVMEDPVDAADADSRPVVARILRDFAARGQQIFLVTSKPASAELFSQLDVPIADLSERWTATVADSNVVAAPTEGPALEVSHEPTVTTTDPIKPLAADVSQRPDDPLFPPMP